MLTVAKLLAAIEGLDPDATVIVGIINGPRYNALDSWQEALASGPHLYILCDEEPRPWEGTPPTLSEDGTATLEHDPEDDGPGDPKGGA